MVCRGGASGLVCSLSWRRCVSSVALTVCCGCPEPPPVQVLVAGGGVVWSWSLWSSRRAAPRRGASIVAAVASCALVALRCRCRRSWSSVVARASVSSRAVFRCRMNGGWCSTAGDFRICRSCRVVCVRLPSLSLLSVTSVGRGDPLWPLCVGSSSLWSLVAPASGWRRPCVVCVLCASVCRLPLAVVAFVCRTTVGRRTWVRRVRSACHPPLPSVVFVGVLDIRGVLRVLVVCSPAPVGVGAPFHVQLALLPLGRCR